MTEAARTTLHIEPTSGKQADVYPRLADRDLDDVIDSMSEGNPPPSADLTLAIIRATVHRLAAQMNLNDRAAA